MFKACLRAVFSKPTCHAEHSATTVTPQGAFVERRGLHLTRHGRHFLFSGCNVYFLMVRNLLTWAADPSLRRDCLLCLDAAKAAGMKVIRTWAFNDGDTWQSLQPLPGQLEERVAQALDWVIAECAKRDLLLVLCLTNYWTAYGGMPQYVKWSPALDPCKEYPDSAFYTDSWCQRAFLDFVTLMLTRRNILTGVAYREDPTIMAWEIANEPRCKDDTTGCTLTKWISSVSRHVRALDSRHLLTCGLEGFFSQEWNDKPSRETMVLYWNAVATFFRLPASACYESTGEEDDGSGLEDYSTDILPKAGTLQATLLSGLGHLDAIFRTTVAQPSGHPATRHRSQDDSRCAAWTLSWLACHERACAAMDLPLVLGELGAQGQDSARAHYLSTVLAGIEDSMRHRGPMAGALVWALFPQRFPSDDKYDILAERLLDKRVGDATCAVLLKHSRAVHAIGHSIAAC